MKPESITRSSAKNLVISAVVAGSTYFALTLVAKRFGGSPGSDAYFFLLSLSTIAIGFTGSLLATVFLPLLVSVRSTRPEEADRFTSSIFTWCLVTGLLGAAASYFWYEPFFRAVSRLNTGQIENMRFVLQYFAPILVVGIAAEFFRVVALSLRMFLVSGLTTLFQPLLLITAIYTLAGSIHEEALALALLLSKVVALALVGAMIYRKAPIRLKLIFRADPHTPGFVRKSVPYWSANVVTNVATFYFDYVASGLGSGVLTSLAYAQRIFALPTLVVLNPILEIARTRFAELQAKGDNQSFQTYYDNLLRVSLYFSIPLAAVFFCFANEIIAAMFQRGAFTAELTAISASCLQIYALSIPFSCAFLVNGRACESYQRLLWPSVFGTIGNLLMIASTFILVRHAGYIGIPLSRLAIDLLYFFPFGFVAIRSFGTRPSTSKILKAVRNAGAASLGGAALAVLLARTSSGMGHGTTTMVICGVLVAFALSYFLLLSLFDRTLGAEVRALYRRPRSAAGVT